MSTVRHAIVLHEERRKEATGHYTRAKGRKNVYLPYMYLSPFSRKQRRTSTLRERKSLQYKVSSFTQSVMQIKLILGRVIVTV